jgi:indolepyruvate ferredoxin oxidoreductase
VTELRERETTKSPQTGTLLSGVDTLARLLFLRGQVDARLGLTTATMVSGYPGSPLGTFDLTLENLGDRLAEAQIVHRPGLNEELAAATVWGSQMGAVTPYTKVDGVVGVWYGKTPGLDRTGDVIKHANAMGAGPNGGAVMFCGDDPSAKSSTLTCDSQYTFEDACMPVLYPGDQQDLLDLGVHAFRMSRFSGTWVGLKIVTTIADGNGTVDLDPGRYTALDLTPSVDGVPWVHHPQTTVGPHAVPGQEELVVTHRLKAAQAYARANQLDRVIGAEPGTRLGIVCAGKTYFDVLQAFADLGISADGLADLGVRVLKLGMTYPLVEETITEFASSVDDIVVIEEKRPFIETQLRSILHEAGSMVPVVGKRDKDRKVLASSVGELDSTAVGAILVRMMPSLAPKPAVVERRQLPLVALPTRPPAFCSGCPHNRSTIFPDGALVGGGVGCHGIMYFETRHQGMKALPPTAMGAEGVPWIGLSPFVDDPHLIQNIGDGTLSHSGTLAIRASVAADVNITFKILYNKAVAMTGGQDVTGLMDVPSMTRALEAEGVKKIVVCAEEPKRYGRRARWARGVTVYGRDRLDQVQEELREVRGVTVIIYDQQCAAEARRLRKKGLQEEPPRRVLINEAVCEGCGDCSAKSNCLSVLPHLTEFGEKREIHDLSCNRDYTCLEGDCPSFVTVTPKKAKKGKAAVKAKQATTRPSLPSGSLPLPNVPTVDRQYGVYFTGIGGTGVVTATKLLAASAESAGFVVGGLDQTGLSQKAGAVVSHLHFAVDRGALGSALVSAEGADLFLSGDILQAAGAPALGKVDPGRTLAVVATDFTPTAAMLQSDIARPDQDMLQERIRDQIGSERVLFVDSKRIAESVFANPLLANVVLVGAAYQLGGLPVSLADVDAAIGSKGKAGESREAFEWGRWAAHDLAAVQARLDSAAHEETADGGSIFDPSAEALGQAASLVASRKLPPELGEFLYRRAAQVIDYQSAALASRFLDLVAEAGMRDEAAELAFTRAVAESWFKLLTYKDEYEVARLHLKMDYDVVAQDLGIDGEYSVKYHLHPPTLRRMGLKHKLPMGKPYEVGFHALRRMKKLRGTKLDPFGYDPDRRTERAVIVEYQQVISESLRRDDLSYEVLLAIAESAQEIKGYGPIKEAAADRWRVRVNELTSGQPASASAGR